MMDDAPFQGQRGNVHRTGEDTARALSHTEKHRESQEKSWIKEPLELLLLTVVVGSGPGCGGELWGRVPRADAAVAQGWFDEWEWLGGEPPEPATEVRSEAGDGRRVNEESAEIQEEPTTGRTANARRRCRGDVRATTFFEVAGRLPEEPPTGGAGWGGSNGARAGDGWGARDDHYRTADEVVYRPTPTSLNLHLGDFSGGDRVLMP